MKCSKRFRAPAAAVMDLSTRQRVRRVEFAGTSPGALLRRRRHYQNAGRVQPEPRHRLPPDRLCERSINQGAVPRQLRQGRANRLRAESGNALYVAQINPNGDGPIATVRAIPPSRLRRLSGTRVARAVSRQRDSSGKSAPATMRLAATACARNGSAAILWPAV